MFLYMRNLVLHLAHSPHAHDGQECANVTACQGMLCALARPMPTHVESGCAVMFDELLQLLPHGSVVGHARPARREECQRSRCRADCDCHLQLSPICLAVAALAKALGQLSCGNTQCVTRMPKTVKSKCVCINKLGYTIILDNPICVTPTIYQAPRYATIFQKVPNLKLKNH